MSAPHQDAAHGALRDELLERGLLLASGVPGLYGRSSALQDILSGFDSLVSAAAAGDRPERIGFPPLMPRDQLEGSGYLRSFPHLCGAVFGFEGGEDDAVRAAELAERHEDWSEYLRMTDLALVPAACYPVYPAIAARGPLSDRGLAVDTGSAWVYRREPSGDPARLQSFQMREIVRLGAPADVLAWRDEWCERALALLRSLGLDATRDNAADQFFGRGGRMLSASQRRQELKFEALVPIAGETPTAIASFNYHQDHFAATYGLALADGSAAHTACLGFGQERVALALLATHGFEPAIWPAEVRRLLWGA